MTPPASSRTIPDVVRPILERLREYMYRHYPERRQHDPLPLEFWRIEDDELFYEVLSYLPLHMGTTDEEVIPNLERMPEGFRLAFPIFRLEDDYQFNGWTALTNAGEWLLPSTVFAYDRIGMTSEARALEAALESCRRDPDDTDAAEAAYKSVRSPYSNDDYRSAELLHFFRANSHLFEA